MSLGTFFILCFDNSGYMCIYLCVCTKIFVEEIKIKRLLKITREKIPIVTGHLTYWKDSSVIHESVSVKPKKKSISQNQSKLSSIGGK